MSEQVCVSVHMCVYTLLCLYMYSMHCSYNGYGLIDLVVLMILS